MTPLRQRMLEDMQIRIPGSHITREGVGDACELGLKRSGLTKPVTPHSLRHYVSRPQGDGGSIDAFLE